MRKRPLEFAVVVVGALAVFSLLFAQASEQATTTGVNTAKVKAPDPPDVTGIWVIPQRARGVLRTLSNYRPPMTPWGKAKFAKVRTSFDGRELGNGVAPEKEWNDPIFQCDPNGYPRVMFHGEMTRFVVTPTEVLQFFERDHTWRDIWMDGRKLPEDPDPRYYGYAVGHWDGDTLVVESNGFIDRTWLDQYGSPHSDQMTTEERFRRVDHDNMEWTIALNDPKTYTKPWVSDNIRLKWAPKSPRSETEEIREDFCIWSDQNSFFKRIDSVGLGDAPTRKSK